MAATTYLLPASSYRLPASSQLVLDRLGVLLLRCSPERIREDANGAAGSAHVLHLAARHPVVDCATADSHHLARLHDRKCLSFDVHCRSLLKNAYRYSVYNSVGLCAQSSLYWRRNPTFYFQLLTFSF